MIQLYNYKIAIQERERERESGLNYLHSSETPKANSGPRKQDNVFHPALQKQCISIVC